MDFKTGRPNHIEDWLIKKHEGQWFGWSDSKNKIYANLIIQPKMYKENENGSIVAVDNPYSKPSEKECTDGLLELQNAFDGSGYKRKRQIEYPYIKDQLDDIYHNGIDGWKATIKVTKDKYPKE